MEMIIAIIIAAALSVLILVSISASWFYVGREYERKRIVRAFMLNGFDCTDLLYILKGRDKK